MLAAQPAKNPDTAARLDVLTKALAAAISNGAIEPNTTCPKFYDSPRIELIVSDTSLEYDIGCEPEGAEQIDMLLYAMLDDLERCRPSQRLSPKIGCESLSPDWGE